MIRVIVKSDTVKIFKESNNVDATVDENIMKLPTKGKPKISVVFYESFESIPDPRELNCNKKIYLMTLC